MHQIRPPIAFSGWRIRLENAIKYFETTQVHIKKAMHKGKLYQNHVRLQFNNSRRMIYVSSIVMLFRIWVKPRFSEKATKFEKKKSPTRAIFF